MELIENDILKELSNETLRRSAFGKVVRCYQEPLYWHIRKMVLTHDDANDLLQNTFLKAWNNIDSFRGESKISTWLYRIATNESLTFLTQQRTRNMASLNDYEDFLMQKMEADSYFDGNEAEKKLQQAILTLPDKQRLVFNMKYFDDLTYEEMENILGTSAGALKASYHIAVKKIETILQKSEL